MYDDQLNRDLTNYIHDLFSVGIFSIWRKQLVFQETNRWYSLIVELDKHGCSIGGLKAFGDSIYSKLVYRCIPAPNYKKTGEILILFNVSGKLWHSLIYYEVSGRE